MAETSPISSSFQEPQVDENANSPVNTDCEDQTDAPAAKGLNESRTELFTRVQNLKKDLQEWRGKLDTQVKTYREELGELRSTLNTEVEQLRVEFQELRNTLKKQLEITSGLARLEPDSLPSNNEHPATAL
ncbi:hypothetical protein CY35_13G048400 [Sphagnum magellanicum]|nr:hypothetical protein CY35_13G048400 [Sphagnum magellanicum]